MQADIPIPRAHDLTGSVLGGRYEVLGKLGVGGMAAVFEGRRIGLHNRVAIKVLKEELCEDPGNVRRFLREARAASVIEHDNIVQIIDFGPVDGTPVYFVMEFLEGSDLRRAIKQLGPLPWVQTQPILLQVVSALAAAHDKGIVHRDVKPANIYLVPRPTGPPWVKVLDFGIAKVVEEGRGGITRGLTMTNGLLGTVAYMAPEQARGGKIDARTDVYALGVVAYQTMTGSVPFTGNNPFMVLERHVNEQPRPPREIVPSIPQAVDEIILKCMAKRPEDRFQSMQEVAAALQSVSRLGVPRMGEPAPVLHGTSAPAVWSAPPDLEVPQGDAAQRVIATERLGSGSNRIVPVSLSGVDHAVGGGTQLTWAPAPVVAGSTAKTPARSGVTEIGSQQSHSTAALPSPYRSFFALGFGVGIVAACVIAFLAITQFDREPAESDLAADQVDEEPAPAPVVVVPPSKAEPPAEEVAAPVEAKVAAPVEEEEVAAPVEEPTKADTPTRTKKKRRDPVSTTKADPPPTKRDPPPSGERPRERNVHPDLREPY
jgi:serine/threonine protein kinase